MMASCSACRRRFRVWVMNPRTMFEKIWDAHLVRAASPDTPAILYVVGGSWLLIWLFARKEDMKEFGAVVQTQTFVS